MLAEFPGIPHNISRCYGELHLKVAIETWRVMMSPTPTMRMYELNYLLPTSYNGGYKLLDKRQNLRESSMFIWYTESLISLGLKAEKQLQNENHTEDWALGSHPRNNCHVTH